MYVHIFGYLVNKLEIWWVYLSPIEKKKKKKKFNWCVTYNVKQHNPKQLFKITAI